MSYIVPLDATHVVVLHHEYYGGECEWIPVAYGTSEQEADAVAQELVATVDIPDSIARAWLGVYEVAEVFPDVAKHRAGQE